jgi:UDP-N-acetyl-D-mannosaminuronic acid transferase (WecB/TagA/CpsF family)
VGARLQNEVVYVPITKEPGPVIDYQHASELRQAADEDAWLARLRAAKIDRVFLGEPLPLESEFVARHPERFQLLGLGQGGRHALFRFVP